MLRAFLMVRHDSFVGIHASATSLSGKQETASGMLRPEHASSLRWRISLAASGVEATTLVMRPSRMVISGPCFLERLARDSWGLGPSSRRLPMIGRPRGPGGSLRFRWRSMA